jgi:large subunit ribosomal protein L24
MKIKTGDTVRVIAGREKGKEGTVIQVFPNRDQVVIEDMNIRTRHLGIPGKKGEGQKIEFPAPIHVSNVQVVSEETGETGRVGYKFIEKDGQKEKVRVLKYDGKTEDLD